MSIDAINCGVARVVELLGNMTTAVKQGDKPNLVKLCESFEEDASDLIEMMCLQAQVSPDEFVRLSGKDQEGVLVREASAGPATKVS